MSAFDVFGIGNALVDMEYTVDDSFLRRHGIDKGHMTLVDEARLDALIDQLDELTPHRTSGGSAANTLIAVQAFGAQSYYVCKVASDDTGRFFVEDLRRIGVETNPHRIDVPGKSGRCLVLITPDGERSMCTFLGISADLGNGEINGDALRRSRYLYVEGFLSSSPSAREAAMECREVARSEGVRSVVTLSDVSMVVHFRDALQSILGNGVDHLFCNEEEALQWARTDRLDIAVNELKDIARTVNVTLGARGSLVVNGRSRHPVAGFPVKPLDTNGAGDIYAGACLAGWCAGMPEETAARFGNFAASHLITRYGARLKTLADYRHLLEAFRSLPQ
jgi:sugar/nucleoside kinase (ribokinase family)